MRKFLLFIVCLFVVMSVSTIADAQTKMTDKQVLEYVKKATKAGKNQKTITQELALRGVDRAQAARVKKLYEEESLNGSSTSEVDSSSRRHTLNNKYKTTPRDEELNEDASGRLGYRRQGNAQTFVWENGYDETIEGYGFVKKDSIVVFGRNVFNNKTLDFAPSSTLATPKNYILGPGDEVVVDIFGANQSTIRGEITPEGYINVDVLGPVFLSGKTIEAANAFLKSKLSSIYSGLSEDAGETNIQLGLGQIRTIQVSVVGDVKNPGTYNLSSLSTAFHAMFQAGGVVDPGTIRSIKVVRNGKVASTVDVYDLLVSGSRKNDIRLMEGDVIIVEPYKNIVKASGAVKRPMHFEMKDGETVADLLKYAGGFDKGAYVDNVSVIRQNGNDSIVSVIESSQFGSYNLQDGDEIVARQVEARFKNRIQIAGAVNVPGVFELNADVNSVRKLIAKAGGLQPEAFLERAIVHRMREDRSLEKLAVDLGGIMNGSKADVALQNNDSLYINSYFELNDYGTLTINGEVAAPGVFPFADNTTVQDLILQAGGLLRSASVARVDVARMVLDKESLVAQSDIATYYTFSLKDGLSLDGADSFVLEPYDVVTVRRSPSFVENKTVSAVGEVNFPGQYNLNKREERIVDLIEKAGGLTDFSYVRGARLFRKFTEEELAQRKRAQEALSATGDTTVVNDQETSYLVSFDLEDAIKNPEGDNNLVLQAGDILDIPVYSNTVRIDGAVQMPTSIAYRKGLNKSDLINAAGGYQKLAYKKRAFVIYMNGSVTKLGRFTKIEPGCQIYVPKKDKTPTENLQKIMSISSSMASLAMMGVSIANLLKK